MWLIGPLVNNTVVLTVRNNGFVYRVLMISYLWAIILISYHRTITKQQPICMMVIVKHNTVMLPLTGV